MFIFNEQLGIAQAGQIVALTVGCVALAALFASAVWFTFRKQANAQWKEVVDSQREKLNLLTTEIGELRIENGELKRDLAAMERRLKRIEEREEELEKDNKRLKALAGEHR